MSAYLDAIARARLEAEFGSHAPEVLESGMPGLQLRLQEIVASAPKPGSGWRPEFGDPEEYLDSVYNCIQQ